MCVHILELWSFENYISKFRPHLRHKILCSFSPSPSTHLLLPSSSYPWLPMVVSFFLTYLLLEVASPIIFLPSPFHCHWFSRSKGLHWWRRSMAYKLHMELHHFQAKWFFFPFSFIFYVVLLLYNYKDLIFFFFAILVLLCFFFFTFCIALNILFKIEVLNLIFFFHKCICFHLRLRLAW